jgi:tetratricopeptide (TPR) repeat protein
MTPDMFSRSTIALSLPWSAVLLLSVAAAQAQSPEDALREGQQLERSGNVQRAVAVYEQYLEKFPEHTQVAATQYRLGKCYDELGMVDESIATLKKAVASKDRRFRNRPDAFYLLAKQYAALDDYDNAVATFEQMLAESPGLYEDEVLNLCGGYYAILGKHDEAAAKLNILKRKQDSPLAEDAAYKLAVLWLKTEKTTPAVEAIQDLAQLYPRNKRIPELLLRAADLYHSQKKYDQTVALAEQLRTRYPESYEAVAGRYLVGLCYRDRGKHEQAVEVFEEVGRSGQLAGGAIAAEAAVQCAEICFRQLNDTPRAIQLYEEAAKLARDAGDERAKTLLEQCYFRLAEHYYQQQQWSVALENYLLLRKTGSQLNVLGRILSCQAKLDAGDNPLDLTEVDEQVLLERVKANAGTAVAAEAELFLIDRKLAETLRSGARIAEIAQEYRDLLQRYPKQVLATDHMESYIHLQIGTALARGEARPEWSQAVEAFEQAMKVDPGEDNPYRISILESLALVAERAGDDARAGGAYRQLFDISKRQLAENPDDAELEKQTLAYMKSLATRAHTDDLIESSLEMCREIIVRHGQLSDLSREARFYTAELYYLRRDFSKAVQAYKEFLRIYGPPQDAAGDFVDRPFKPDAVDDKVRQMQDAAVRIAHCWYLQSHESNMIRAYEWIVRNMPTDNPHAAEAQYWLALQLGKGKPGETREGKRQMAEALWTNVVNTSLDFYDSNFSKSFHFWVGSQDERVARTQKYVETAAVKSAALLADLKQHELAANILKWYVQKYPRSQDRENLLPGQSPDELFDMAHYALGRQYAALNDADNLIATYEICNVGMRDSKFRVSSLKLMGYHAGQAEIYDRAIEAYATLLDEYGENEVDEEGKPVPVPREQQLRQGRTNWDGIRLPVPEDLDQGEVRFALGLMYFRQRDWSRCGKSLAGFIEDRRLAKNASRPQALYMLGQSRFQMEDYQGAVQALQALVRDHPRFEAIQEAYVYAARALYETKAWAEIDLNHRRFVAEWPNSHERPRMDLYAALAQMGQGQRDSGLANLKSLAQGETYEDVQADACYHLAVVLLEMEPPRREAALQLLEKSVAVYPRPEACLAGGKCCMELKQWDRAEELLDRVTRDFPDANKRLVNEAKQLLGEVVKMANQK